MDTVDTGKKLLLDARQGEINSAYIVKCDKQSELEKYAEDFLLSLYCERKASCGICHSCKMILSENSPDILKIMPDKGMIKVDMIRQVNTFLNKKSYEGSYKVVVIYQAQMMNIVSQNALLKPLEEPPAGTSFLLLCSSDFGLLPTVISRCQGVRLLPQEEQDIVSLLIEDGTNKETALLAARLSKGYLNQAKSIAENEEYLSLRQAIIKNLFRFIDQKNYAITYFVDDIEKNKAHLSEIMDIIKTVLMDILKYKYTSKADIVYNIDMIKEIELKANIFTTGSLCNMIDKLLVFENRLNFNVNFRLNCESMLFEMLEEKYRWLK